MILIYEGNQYITTFPNDSKYFRKTRSYFPTLKIRIGEREIEIKFLKCLSEVRAGIFNKHHMKNRSRGGSFIESNLLRMDISRHNCFHILFGNLDFDEIIELLKRVKRIKEAQKKSLRM